MSDYFCIYCGCVTANPFISECGMYVCPQCKRIGGLISDKHRHLDALRAWLDPWHLTVNARPGEGEEMSDFCLACNAQVDRVDPSRGCSVCGHVSVVRRDDITPEFVAWYEAQKPEEA
jgi:hypothetical protein